MCAQLFLQACIPVCHSVHSESCGVSAHRIALFSVCQKTLEGCWASVVQSCIDTENVLLACMQVTGGLNSRMHAKMSIAPYTVMVQIAIMHFMSLSYHLKSQTLLDGCGACSSPKVRRMPLDFFFFPARSSAACGP
jgi:hypothetical protein